MDVSGAKPLDPGAVQQLDTKIERLDKEHFAPVYRINELNQELRSLHQLMHQESQNRMRLEKEFNTLRLQTNISSSFSLPSLANPGQTPEPGPDRAVQHELPRVSKRVTTLELKLCQLEDQVNGRFGTLAGNFQVSEKMRHLEEKFIQLGLQFDHLQRKGAPQGATNLEGASDRVNRIHLRDIGANLLSDGSHLS